MVRQRQIEKGKIMYLVSEDKAKGIGDDDISEKGYKGQN